MNVIKLLMDVLTGHQQNEHSEQANFNISIIKNGEASAKCNNCNMHFGISA